MSSTTILHCSASREDHGGIQSTLAHHHAHDASLGFSPRFLSYFDQVAAWSGDCVTLTGHGWMTVGALRRAFGQAATARAADVAIYHDGWGLDWFAPCDSARRRILFLHTERPYSDELIRAHGSMVDGFMAVSQAYAGRVRRVLPKFPVERICALPFHVEPPAWAGLAVNKPAEKGPLRLGYAGRIQAGHKRLDRLPALIAELDRRGLDYVFELVGDGSYQAELQRRLADHPRVVFRGWLEGEDYFRAVAGWDVLVMLSDYEGFSRAGMEAMNCGVVPVHPDFSPAAAELLGPAAGVGLYPVGDMAAAAERIAGLAALGAAGRRSLGLACRAHLAPRTPAAYQAVYREFLLRIIAAPMLPARLPSPPIWHGWLPLGVYTRLFPRRF